MVSRAWSGPRLWRFREFAAGTEPAVSFTKLGTYMSGAVEVRLMVRQADKQDLNWFTSRVPVVLPHTNRLIALYFPLIVVRAT